MTIGDLYRQKGRDDEVAEHATKMTTSTNTMVEMNACSAPDGITDDAEMVEEPFTKKAAEKNNSVKPPKDQFQVKTAPLSTKGVELFFRPRSKASGPYVISLEAEAETVEKPFTKKAAEKNASVKTPKDQFQVKTEPLSTKGVELFFRPRSTASRSCVIFLEAEAVEEAVSQDVDAMEGISEGEEAVEEPVSQVETVGDSPVNVGHATTTSSNPRTKLPKRKRQPGIPCKCTFPGACCGKEFNSQKTLNVHVAKKHGDHIKANEKTARDNELQAKNRKKRRKEDPDWRENERARNAAYRKEKNTILPHCSENVEMIQ